MEYFVKSINRENERYFKIKKKARNSLISLLAGSWSFWALNDLYIRVRNNRPQM